MKIQAFNKELTVEVKPSVHPARVLSAIVAVGSLVADRPDYAFLFAGVGLEDSFKFTLNDLPKSRADSVDRLKQ